MKTLKDLPTETFMRGGVKLVTVLELKEAAREWIKDMREGHSFEPIPMPKKEFTNDKTVNCFKCFFNIKEDEIK